MITVSQLMKFNTFIQTWKDSSLSYYSIWREPPLTTYLGMMIHNKTGDLSLNEKLSKLGLCILKHWLPQFSTSMVNTVMEANGRHGVVLPIDLKQGVFSTASVDNIESAFNHHCQHLLCMAQRHLSINTQQGIMKDSLENTSVWIKAYPS